MPDKFVALAFLSVACNLVSGVQFFRYAFAKRFRAKAREAEKHFIDRLWWAPWGLGSLFPPVSGEKNVLRSKTWLYGLLWVSSGTAFFLLLIHLTIQ